MVLIFTPYRRKKCVMSPPKKAQHGAVIFRRWDQSGDLSEEAIPFQNIDELFALCLQNRASELIDRVLIDGLDEQGKPQTITLLFQSASITPHDDTA